MAIKCHQMAIKCFWLLMGCVDNQQSKKFGCHSSSLKVTQNFQSPTTNCTTNDQIFLIINWPTIQLVTKGNQNQMTNGN
jgi:hypothetical protein